MPQGVFRISSKAKAAAIYLLAPGGGDPTDDNATMHRPLLDPENWLDHIIYHSDLDQMEVSHGPTNVTVHHAAVPAGSGAGGQAGYNGTLEFGQSVANHVLLTHSLGYVPDFMVIWNGNVLYVGQPVQVLDDGRTRQVATYADESMICLREWSARTSNGMAASSQTYTVIVFKRPPAHEGSVLLRQDSAAGILQMASGRFDVKRRYLQVVAGGSPFGFPLGPTMDTANGAVRYVSPSGSIVETVPASFGMAIQFKPHEPGDAPFGASMAYNGSFAGSASVLVQVP